MGQPTRVACGWHALMAEQNGVLVPRYKLTTWTIAVSNLRHRTRSATRATPPIPAPSVLRLRQEPRRQSDRSSSLAQRRSVRATVSQQQPAYLAECLVCPTVNIPRDSRCPSSNFDETPCILALTGSISFQGSPTLSSPTCGIASNSTAPDALGFTGNSGINLNAPSFTAGGCSQTGGNQCDNVTTHAAPVPNPLSGLDSAMSSLKTSDFSGR